jgi:16S rRNA G966 N2-methylase RsmD
MYYNKYIYYKEKYLEAKYGGSNSEPQLITDRYFETFFPDTDNKNNIVDKSLLQMTNVGLYSITKKYDTTQIINIMKKYIPHKLDNLTITESSGGVGGDTISFAKYFNKVNTVEIIPLHCSVIKNNIGVYNIDNVNVICDNYLSVYDKITQDVVYIDPPWGGPQYKFKKNISLYFNNVNILSLIDKIDAKYIFLKVPKNFDVSKLQDYNHHIEKLFKFNIICILLV